MTLQSGQQAIAIDILPNISRSKGNQTIKVGQLIKYKWRNIFLEKSYSECGEETSPRPFSAKLKLNISLDQQPKILQFVFIVCQVESYRNIMRLSCRPLAFTSYQAFCDLELFSLSLIFCINFEEKHFSCYALLIDQVPLSGCF